MSKTRREFLAAIGAAVIAVPALSNTTTTEVAETGVLDWAIGFYDSEFWEISFNNPALSGLSIFAEARSFDDDIPRIVSVLLKRIPGKRTIQIDYLEPTPEPYPTTEEGDE